MTEEQQRLLEEVNAKLDRLDASIDRQYNQNTDLIVRLSALYNLFLRTFKRLIAMIPS